MVSIGEAKKLYWYLVVVLWLRIGRRVPGREDRVVVLVDLVHLVMDVEVDVGVVMPGPQGEAEDGGDRFILLPGLGDRRRHDRAEDLVLVGPASGTAVGLVDRDSVFMLGSGVPA